MKAIITALFFLCTFSVQVQADEDVDYATAEILSLAENIMFEACGEGKQGWINVGMFTIWEADRKDMSIAQAVYGQGWRFTWTQIMAKEDQIKFIEENYTSCWLPILAIATEMYVKPDNFDGKVKITPLHNHYLNPKAVKKLPFWYKHGSNKTKVGKHVFVEYD